MITNTQYRLTLHVKDLKSKLLTSTQSSSQQAVASSGTFPLADVLCAEQINSTFLSSLSALDAVASLTPTER